MVGDIIIIKKNTIIPADCVLLHSRNLTMVQGYLTGNLQEVHKDVHENENAFVYKTSVCVSGAGRAIVVAVGANTQQLLLEKFD